MNDFTPVAGAIGGALIGLSAALLLALNGRIAGISGIVGGLLRPVHGDVLWRMLFVIGLALGAGGWALATGATASYRMEASLPMLGLAGLLVGFGTAWGSGCTSGHGICGLARLSPRSIVAVCVFMLTGGATVFVLRHLLGVGS
jgi:uncharacterized membrane protein YedE/YeeE